MSTKATNGLYSRRFCWEKVAKLREKPSARKQIISGHRTNKESLRLQTLQRQNNEQVAQNTPTYPSETQMLLSPERRRKSQFSSGWLLVTLWTHFGIVLAPPKTNRSHEHHIDGRVSPAVATPLVLTPIDVAHAHPFASPRGPWGCGGAVGAGAIGDSGVTGESWKRRFAGFPGRRGCNDPPYKTRHNIPNNQCTSTLPLKYPKLLCLTLFL